MNCEKDIPGVGCCCVCIHHHPDYSHPLTDGKRMSEQRGWVCYPPEFEGAVFSGWSEHGICEMFTDKRK